MRADIHRYEIGTRRVMNMAIMLSMVHYKLLLVDEQGESHRKQILGIHGRGNQIEV